MTQPNPSLEETFYKYEDSRRTSQRRRSRDKRKLLLFRAITIIVLIALGLWTYILLR